MSRPVDLLICHLRGVASSDVEWEADFARSILKQSRRHNWKPSQKQAAIMDRMVGDLFDENDLILIED